MTQLDRIAVIDLPHSNSLAKLFDLYACELPGDDESSIGVGEMQALLNDVAMFSGTDTWTEDEVVKFIHMAGEWICGLLVHGYVVCSC